jgi:hypothetical protein
VARWAGCKGLACGIQRRVPTGRACGTSVRSSLTLVCMSSGSPHGAHTKIDNPGPGEFSAKTWTRKETESGACRVVRVLARRRQMCEMQSPPELNKRKKFRVEVDLGRLPPGFRFSSHLSVESRIGEPARNWRKFQIRDTSVICPLNPEIIDLADGFPR